MLPGLQGEARQKNRTQFIFRLKRADSAMSPLLSSADSGGFVIEIKSDLAETAVV
jgi:hypothetical protein